MSKEEDMQRTLTSQFASFNVQWNAVTNEYDFVTLQTTDYTRLGYNLYFTQQDIDLTGYAMDKKTFYPYSSFEQRGGFTSGTAVTPLTRQPYIVETVIISSVPMSNNNLIACASFSPGFTDPIQGALRFDRSVIIHGEQRVYTIDSTLAVQGQNNVLKLLDRNTYSSLEPTAADKLYCYKLVTLLGTPGELVQAFVPSTRVLMPGTISSEPKIEYMMRLKRSYELANQV